MMTRIALTFVCLAALAAIPVAAQRRVPIARPEAKPTPTAKPAEIPAADWESLAEALRGENWARANELATQQIALLRFDNERKQLAQLRYLQIFAIAGQILELNAKGKADEAEKIWIELDRLAVSGLGKEFVLPPREFAADCSKKLNFICRVRSTPKALRTTATNKDGNGIHSFDYVRFESDAPLLAENGTKIFLGGILENAEYNDDPAKPWVIRLFFTGGFVFAISENGQ